MSAILSAALVAPSPALRLGRDGGADGRGERVVQWLMRRNCALAPHQMLAAFGGLVLVASLIAGFFWLHGATLVAPFAALEVAALGLALVVHARHVRDGESIRLADGRLTVEQQCGPRTLCVDFQPAWVRVEPESGDRSLVELSGQGRRVVVGRYVRPELRRKLADEIRWALRRRPATAAGLAA